MNWLIQSKFKFASHSVNYQFQLFFFGCLVFLVLKKIKYKWIDWSNLNSNLHPIQSIANFNCFFWLFGFFWLPIHIDPPFQFGGSAVPQKAVANLHQIQTSTWIDLTTLLIVDDDMIWAG